MIALIGGTGLEGIERLGFAPQAPPINQSTPFGWVSSPIVNYGSFLFVSRFGSHHEFSPTSAPYRANIYALKAMGVTTIVSISAAGSFSRAVPPGSLALPGQLIDRTTRPSSFFIKNGPVVHVGMRDPFCPSKQHLLGMISGTYLCMEGPALSTRAESLENARIANFVGMTIGTEARLCREAQVCYVPMLIVTDYDLDGLSADDNRQSARLIGEAAHHAAFKALELFIGKLPAMISKDNDACACRRALEDAVLSTKPVDGDTIFSVLRR